MGLPATRVIRARGVPLSSTERPLLPLLVRPGYPPMMPMNLAWAGDNFPVADNVAAASTRLLRGSHEPLFERLRALLTERDVDPQATILVDFFPGDVDQEFGLVVTQDRRVIQFVIRYGRLGDLNRQAADAVIDEWNDITPGWEATPYAAAIRVALDFMPED